MSSPPARSSRFLRYLSRILPRRRAVTERLLRELIFSFRFKEADALVSTSEARLTLDERALKRLRKATRYGRTSQLVAALGEEYVPRNFSRLRYRLFGAPATQALGKWWIRGIDEQRVLVRGIVDGSCRRVGLFINDRLVRLINTEEIPGDKRQRRKFKFNLKEDAIRRFPKKATIGFGTMGGYLVRRGSDKLTYRNALINGDGTLFKKLARNYFINKKGQLKLALDQDEDWKARAMVAYETLKEYFERTFGYKTYFICGTLLGYAREHDFIPHDDDLDVSFLSKETSPEGVKREMTEIVFRMLLDGFDIKLARRPGFFKPRINGIKIDVTPMWHDRGELWMLNATHLRDGPHIIEPVQVGRFRGCDVYVPSNPERVLELEYGPGWKVPDPGYRTRFDPDDDAYLLRSCLSLEEMKELYQRYLKEASRRPGVGRLSAVAVNLESLVTGEGGRQAP